MAFVPGAGPNGALVMIGGRLPDNSFATGLGGTVAAVWLWRDDQWFEVSAAGGPSPRSGALAAYDPVRGKLVMHGGSGSAGTWLNETWEWTLAGGWMQFAGAVPTNARIDMAFNSASNRMAVVRSGGSGIPEVHEYDGVAWTLAGIVPPLPFISNFAVATAPSQAGLAFFGGAGGTGPSTYDGLYLWNAGVATAVQTSGARPGGRFDARMTLDTARNRLVVYGGEDEWGLVLIYTPETWEWGGGNWIFPPAASLPAMRDDAGLVATPTRGGALMEGGRLPSSTPNVNDTWSWEAGEWTRIGSGLTQTGNSIAYDPIRDRVVRFDGATTWYHYEAFGWVAISSALPRPSARGPMAYDPRRDRCILFDGNTWLWNGSSWSQVVTTGAVPPFGGTSVLDRQSLVFDEARDELILVTFNAGTWAWQFPQNAWQLRGPSPTTTLTSYSHIAGVTYDGNRDRVLAIGNATAPFWSQQPVLFQWDGTSWDQGSPLGTAVRGSAAGLAYIPELEASLLVTGNGSWLLRSQFPATLEPLPPGCSHATDRHPTLTSNSVPWLGDTLPLTIGELAPTSTPLLGVFGFDATSWAGLPLPLDLGVIGMTDCELQVRVDVPVGLGSAVWNLAIPNDPQLVGIPAWCQTLVFAPGANPANLLATNGVALRFGRR
jgi:hypothetical protein